MTTIRLDVNRIIVTTDVRSVAGELRVEAGARGTIASRDQDRYLVVFDNTSHFVQRDVSGRRHQFVPVISTQVEAVFDWNRTLKSLASL